MDVGPTQELLGTSPGRVGAAIRPGHAVRLRGDDAAVPDDLSLIAMFEFLCGDRGLSSRTPSAAQTVSGAENALGYDANARPVYCFLGDLHPDLGTVGLVVERRFAESASGVSKCDSGGLFGGKGGFAAIPEPDRSALLCELSFIDGKAGPDWEPAFDHELEAHHGSARDYVDGRSPRQPLSDRRAEVVRAAGDRRAWTWELRTRQEITETEVVAVVLSPERAKALETFTRKSSIRAEVLTVAPTERGIAYAFHSTIVREVLHGDR
jgi:hypothetical protein